MTDDAQDASEQPRRRKFVPKRWWRRRTYRPWTLKPYVPNPEHSAKMKRYHASRTPLQKQQTRERMSASVRKYWSKLGRIHRLRPRKKLDTTPHVEAATKIWAGMTEEERAARKQSISEGMKRRWAQRSTEQRSAISAKRTRTMRRQKLAELKENGYVETLPPQKLTPKERSFLNARSPFETKMDKFRFQLQTLDDTEAAYKTFWASLTPLQKKRVIRIAVNAYKKGHHVTNSAIS